MANKFEPGDLVKLKSGGPLMTVEFKSNVGVDEYGCSWFDKSDKHIQRLFKGAALEKSEKNDKTTINVKIV